MSAFDLSRTPLPALLLDLEQLASSMRRYHSAGNYSASEQAWADAMGVVQEINTRFAPNTTYFLLETPPDPNLRTRTRFGSGSGVTSLPLNPDQ